MRIALTPNLAIDRLLVADGIFTVSGVNRVTVDEERAGGKGVNLARAYRALGGEILVAGFVAGSAGRRVSELLEGEGFDVCLARGEGETRSCHIIRHGDDHPTQVLEGGPVVSRDAWRELLARLPSDSTVISGSWPAGLDQAAMGEVLRSFRSPPVVDTSGVVLEAAVAARAALITPNRDEFAALVRPHDDVEAAAAEHFERHGVPLLITLGMRGALWVATERRRVRPPTVRALDPVGSGDAFLGAFLWARDHGEPLDAALRLAAAAGADNARNGGGGRVTRDGILELAERARVEAFE